MKELTAQVASHYLFSSLKNQYDDLTNISSKISRQSPDEIIDFLMLVSVMILSYSKFLESSDPKNKLANEHITSILEKMPVKEITQRWFE